MRDEQGRLLRTYNRERAHLNAYLEDHAYLLEALVALYEARFDPARLASADRNSPMSCSSASPIPTATASSPPPPITSS